MANYHEYSCFTQTNPDEIGMGTGNDENGKLYICLAGLIPQTKNGDWISLSLECAKELKELLEVFDIDELLKMEKEKTK